MMDECKIEQQIDYLAKMSKTPQHELITDCLEHCKKQGVIDLTESEVDEFIRGLKNEKVLHMQ